MDDHTSYSQSSAAEYYANAYWKKQDLWTSFADCAALNPYRVAFVEDDKQILFRDLLDASKRLARGLRTHGVGPGDVVVIHGRNTIESVQAMLACAYVGAVMTPIPPMFSVAQLTAVCESSHARMLIALVGPKDLTRSIAAAQAAQVKLVVVADADHGATPSGLLAWSDLFGESPAEERENMNADALALLVYSSGTTGAPKGVMHSANTARYAIEQRARLHGISAQDVGLVAAQFGFVGSAVFGLLLGAITGMTQVLMHSWNADTAVRLMEKHHVSYAMLMPTHVHDVLASPELDRADLSSLTRCGMSGLPREHRIEVQRRLCHKPLPTYGMSECLGYATCGITESDDKLINTDGHPFPGTHTMVLGEDGNPAPVGQTGPILVRGPSRFLGYYGSPELTSAALTADGYYRTGDIGKLDADGFLTFVARVNDIIRRGGIMIVPVDAEAVLMTHPKIEHVAIVGLPDPRLGERACACVISRDGQPIALEEITSFLEQREVARYTWPEKVAMFTSFPRSASLKVQKRALIEQLVKS